MLEEDISDILQMYGLTKTQAQIFIHLIRSGASSVRELSRALKKNRMNIYRNLKRMENMGLVSVIPGRPIKFSAVPANIALNTLLLAAKSRISELESKYATVLDALSKISKQQQEYAVETKFRIHNGRRRIYAIMMRMLEECEQEVCLLTTPNDLICLSLYNFDEALKKLNAKGVKVKIITNIANERTAAMLMDFMRHTIIKHSDIDLRTRFLIVDDKAAFTSLTVDDSTSLDNESDSGFWTDSPHYIKSLKVFFDIVWRNAQDISAVLQYLKTGKTIERAVMFSDLAEYHKYFLEMLDGAKSHVLICVKRLMEPYVTRDFSQILKKVSMRGVKIKMITHLDDYFHTLKEIMDMSDAIEVRHIDAEYAKINFIVVDMSESLLCCFPSNFISRHMTQVQGLWSNFISFTYMLNEIFMEMWSKATNSAVRLMEIKFMRAVKEIPEKLGLIAKKKGLLLEVAATIKGISGLSQRFDLILRTKDPRKEIIVGDILPERGNVKAALISLYVKAIDVKARQKLLLIPREEMLSADERDLAATYNIDLISGLDPAELSQKILERIKLPLNL